MDSPSGERDSFFMLENVVVLMNTSVASVAPGYVDICTTKRGQASATKQW